MGSSRKHLIASWKRSSSITCIDLINRWELKQPPQERGTNYNVSCWLCRSCVTIHGRSARSCRRRTSDRTGQGVVTQSLRRKKIKRDGGERRDEGGGSILTRGASSSAMANRPTAFSSFRRGGTPVITVVWSLLTR